ncbi:uncharacterized protein BXZ73DRAFT_52815 [Epithele typhae]|uniref:uncharacterized protein n=1 Tax=Epithele typhae TaxID=378194 RepID=UPI002008934B|nr:uncharacterized protein BXZ73DRAFT_52815 [Epithele typhae]KAH9918713.1 hypothetical protein BXZ73DRAFT_52815 [Epithele typhae]
MSDPEPSSSPASPASSSSPRSVSRGREAFVRPPCFPPPIFALTPPQSSGRGGVGNIRKPSKDVDPTAVQPDEPLSPVRGREAAIQGERAKSSGRGGMGNIRSGSKARAIYQVSENHPQTAALVATYSNSMADYERSVVQHSQDTANARAHSSGRGGVGNITSKSKSDSESRSRSRVAGRGGAGNLHAGASVDPEHLARLEQQERLMYAHMQGSHSTGRGGRANITNLPEPSSPHSHDFEATDRGGVGNITQARSPSREPRSRSASGIGSRDRSSSLARILNKVGLHSARDENPEHDRTALTEDDPHE